MVPKYCQFLLIILTAKVTVETSKSDCPLSCQEYIYDGQCVDRCPDDTTIVDSGDTIKVCISNQDIGETLGRRLNASEADDSTTEDVCNSFHSVCAAIIGVTALSILITISTIVYYKKKYRRCDPSIGKCEVGGECGHTSVDHTEVNDTNDTPGCPEADQVISEVLLPGTSQSYEITSDNNPIRDKHAQSGERERPDPERVPLLHGHQDDDDDPSLSARAHTVEPQTRNELVCSSGYCTEETELERSKHTNGHGCYVGQHLLDVASSLSDPRSSVSTRNRNTFLFKDDEDPGIMTQQGVIKSPVQCEDTVRSETCYVEGVEMEKSNQHHYAKQSISKTWAPIEMSRLGEDYLNACIKEFRQITHGLTRDKLVSTNFTNRVFASGLFDYEGGHLKIEGTDVDLFIPPYAIDKDEPELREVYVFLNMSKTSRNGLSDNQLQVTPVVHLGPPGTKFAKQVILTIPHCVTDVNRWQDFCAVTSDTNIGEPQLWKKLSAEDNSHTYITDDSFVVLIQGFSDKVVYATPNTFSHGSRNNSSSDSTEVKAGGVVTPSNSSKKIRIGLYMAPDDFNHSYLMCYLRVWNDTEADHRVVDETEKKAGRQKCCATRSMKLDVTSASNLVAELASVEPPSWKPLRGVLEIPCKSILEQNNIISEGAWFSLQNANERQDEAAIIKLEFHIYQDGHDNVTLTVERDLDRHRHVSDRVYEVQKWSLKHI